MYKKILVAVNDSFNSELAARHAVAIAASSNGELIVLGVDDGGIIPDDLSSAVDRVVNRSKNIVNARGIIRKGEFFKTTLATVYAEHADLLVIAISRRRGTQFIGSKAGKLMQKASCSVLAVMAKGITIKGTGLLLPIKQDQSVNEEQILLIEGLAKFYNLSVELLKIIEQRRWYNLPWERLYKLRSGGEDSMLPFIKEMKEKGIEADTRAVIAENRTKAIIKEIAIGKHSMVLIKADIINLLKEFVFGNPVDQIISKGLCDVLIWRPAR